MQSSERAEAYAPREQGGPVAGHLLVGLADDVRHASAPPSTGPVVRAFDVVGAAALMVLFAPVILICILLVKLGSSGPLIHRSERLAQGGGTFGALKFRSMVTNGDEVIEAYFQRHPELRAEYARDLKLAKDPRVTSIGHWLRVLSLDELPQLLNVMRGEMSLVGPRPKLLSERPLYGDKMDHVLSVRPGITGLWQVSGRSAVSYQQRIEMDVSYVDSRNLPGDVVICLKTAGQLLRPSIEEAH